MPPKFIPFGEEKKIDPNWEAPKTIPFGEIPEVKPTLDDHVQNFIDQQSSFKEQKKRTDAYEIGATEAAFSGAPLAPANKTDINAGAEGFNPLKLAGKTLANTVSDLPSIVKGAWDFAWHPIEGVKGMANYYAGIAKETLGAISEAVKTGDMARIHEDIQKATVAMVDHPLQTIAAFEGAKGIAKGGAEFVKNPVKAATDVTDKVTNTLDSGKLKFEALKQSFKDKGITFESNSALHKKTVEIQGTLRDKIEKQKTVTDLQAELESMSAKTKERAQGKAKEIEAKTRERVQKELELEQAKREVSDLGKMQKQQVREAAQTTQDEAKSKGFGTQREMQDSITETRNIIQERAESAYEENLGNAKIDFSGFVPAMEKVITELKNNSMVNDVKALKPIIENIKLRDLVTEYGSDPKKLQTELGKRGIVEPADQVIKDNPPLTSDNFKGTVNAIRGTLKENNPYAFKLYDEHVTPVMTSAFRDAIKNEAGDTVLSKIDETDQMYRDLKSNPLFDKKEPTLADVNSNWNSFVKNAEQLPEGKQLVDKFKNYALEQILTKAKQGSGDFSPGVINNEMKKYPNIIKGDVENQLKGIVDLNNTLNENISTAKETIQKKKSDVTTTKEDIANLVEEQKKIKSDAKSIGENPEAVIKNIKGLKSINGIQEFLKKTGKSIEDVRKVMAQSLIEKVDPRLLEDKTIPFDVSKTPDLLKELKEIGKSEDGIEYKKVNDEILGKEGIETIKDIEKVYDKYKNAKTIEEKGSYGRVLQGLWGTFLFFIGHFIWGGIEITRALSEKGAIAGKESNGREVSAPIKPTKPKSSSSIKNQIMTIGGMDMASKQDDKKE